MTQWVKSRRTAPDVLEVEHAVRFQTPPGIFPRVHATPLGRLGTRLFKLYECVYSTTDFSVVNEAPL
jgi:hypothetical protein